MSFLSVLRTGITAMVNDVTKPIEHKIGDSFENYVRKVLFIERYYTLVERTHSYDVNHEDYVESSLKPDFTFRDHWLNKEFYIEAKFRSTLYDDKIIWCTDEQLERYKFYNRQKPVFLMLGCGLNPKEPEYLSLIPLHQARYTGLYLSLTDRFEIEPDKPVTSKVLWNR